MFSSSGLFSDINCPFTRRELCERPHCLYKHAADARDTFGSSTQSSIMDLTGVQKGNEYAGAGAPENDDTKDYCLHELDRINKEIETVRHEVEQEQRRLSRYQTIQAHSRNNAPVSKCVTTGKHLDRSSYGLPSFTDFDKTHARPRKYVVDNSKPRTDLEYDPLSNFSADLRSYNSSGKEQKMKHSQDLKRARNDCDQKDPASHQAKFSRSPSPEPLDDSNEDGVLIIDVPPSPDKTRRQAQKPVDFCQDTAGDVKKVKTVPALLDSLRLHTTNAETFKVTSPSATRVETSEVYCGVESNRDLPTFNEYKECKNVTLDGSVVDLTECLEDLRSECQKLSTGLLFQSTETVMENISEPVSLPATSEQRDPSLNDPRCELTSGDEKMNPQPPPKSSLFHKAPAANSPRRQHTRQDEPAHNRVRWPLQQPATSSVPGSQKMSSKKPEEVQGEAAIDRTSPVRYQQPAEPASSSSHSQPCHVSSTSVDTHLTARVESLPELTEQLLETAENEEVIIITDDDELSDSDTMEECYRIFMEANNEEKGNEDYPDVSIEATDVAEKKVNVTPEALAGKKRVAHEAKLTEEPVAKLRPQPQVLVPLRGPAASGFGSRPPTTSKIQQVQQRASMMSAAVKGGQAFVSSNCEKIPESHNSPSALTPTPENLYAAPAQNACLNYISLGTAVIEVGNNLHLILPNGTFPLPVTSTSSPVTSVLTPISQAHTSAFKQTYHPPAVTLVQKCRPTAPVLIPAPARKPSPTSALTSSTSSPAAFMAPPAPVQAAPKSVPAKRKVKQQCEAPKDKVPHDIRQRYINMFTEEFLKTSANVNDAFEKALIEEKTVYNRSMNKLKYLSVAVNALKRLKNQSAVAAKEQNEVESQRFKGNISFNPKKFKGNDDMVLYESLKDYILTDERLIESNYPLQHPEKRSCAALFADNKKVTSDPLKRICCRCGATYSVSQSGKHIRKEECNYHYGKGVEKRVPGGVETRYSCCEGVMGAPGCQVFQLHVHDALSLDGFVSTVPRRPSDTSCPGVYSLDCEMCYTIHGLELSRVTVVNSSLQVVYDTYVRPDNEVIDYITRFSGISEEDVKGSHTSLREVQETLLSFISSDTILVGHGLETDLCLLKLLHGKVVDTSVVFPHRLGPPHKLTLNNLTAEYLRRIIQESVCGHDTAEDAAACMELLLWKGKEDGKLKK